LTDILQVCTHTGEVSPVFILHTCAEQEKRRGRVSIVSFLLTTCPTDMRYGEISWLLSGEGPHLYLLPSYHGQAKDSAK